MLRAGRVPFFEPGLPEKLDEALASGRLHFTTDFAVAFSNNCAEQAIRMICGAAPLPVVPAAPLVPEAAKAALRDLEGLRETLTEAALRQGIKLAHRTNADFLKEDSFARLPPAALFWV